MNRNVLYAAILLGAIIIGYSLYVTFQSGAATQGVVVCPNENECYWTQHIHAYVPVYLCGEFYRLPTEVGSLEDEHTHEEVNTIHLHTRIPYDPVTQSVKDTTFLQLGTFFDGISVPFGEGVIDGKNNGDSCDASTGTLKMFVNGLPSNEFRSYVWSDRDVVSLYFDNRTSAEIATELAANPVEFPTLGRG